MVRREFSRKTRQQALERSGLRCEAAGARYGFEAGQRCNCSLSLGVQFDHVLPDQMGGDNTLSNCAAICVQCHKYATRNDIRTIRKSDRQRDKSSGVVRPKQTISSAPFPPSDKAKRVGKTPLPPRILFRQETQA